MWPSSIRFTPTNLYLSTRVARHSQRCSAWPISAAGRVEYFSYNQECFSYHVYGDTVVMTGRTSSVVKFQGRVNRILRLFTNIYVKVVGQWRLVAHQATPIVEE
jgi:hypothetical protein